MKTVHVIGMGLSPADLTESHLALIRAADLLVGGRRHLAHFTDLGIDTLLIDRNIEAVLKRIGARSATEEIVVLASGDPLFFGIGSLIAKRVGHDQVVVHPNISSVAGAFARIKEPWSDAGIVSLHGRSREYQLLVALKTHRRVAVLTDPGKNPAWLARFLCQHGLTGWRMGIFSRLGAPDEQFGWHTLEAAQGLSAADPNVVILKQSTTKDGLLKIPLHLGQPEADYDHAGTRDNGLITKSEVRAVTLAKLALQAGQTLWDLGAGSGSVGIEASLLLGHGRICAVEKDPQRVDQIRANAGRFGITTLEVHHAELPDGLAALPPPDRIFIGGGGRRLAEIIKTAAAQLSAGGIVVINTVLLDNLQIAVDTLQRQGFTTETTQIQIARSKQMPWSARLAAQNPVWIIRGEYTQ